MRKLKKLEMDLTGQVFGRLTVISDSGERTPRGNRLWLCQCECGAETKVVTAYLRSGQTKSCGCLKAERCERGNVKHGFRSMSDTAPEYSVWITMRARCNNPNDAGFPNYGGRGIRVCARWDEFPNFYADMGPRPSAAHSIERIDNAGNYTPENCRWATRTEQNRNRRTSKLVTFRNETKPLAEWAEELDYPYETLKYRLHRGWPVDEAFTWPSGVKRPRGRKQQQP